MLGILTRACYPERPSVFTRFKQPIVMRRRNNDPLISIILFGAFAALAVVWLIVARFWRKRRTEAMQRVAGELGLTFAAIGSEQFVTSLGWSELFSRGRAKKVSNLSSGSSDGREVAVFDYQFITGHGKSTQTWRSTVVSLRFDGHGLPRFSLRPEGVWDKVKSWFGGADINFDTHPQFSRSYVLRGENESAIRALFTNAVLEFYEQNPGVNTEALGNSFLFYRHAKLVAPADISSFLASAFEALSLFQSGDVSRSV
jgi:hypothetical protein